MLFKTKQRDVVVDRDLSDVPLLLFPASLELLLVSGCTYVASGPVFGEFDSCHSWAGKFRGSDRGGIQCLQRSKVSTKMKIILQQISVSLHKCSVIYF